MGNDSMIAVLSQYNEQGESAIIKISSHDIIVITTPNGSCNIPLNEIMKLVKEACKEVLGFHYKED